MEKLLAALFSRVHIEGEPAARTDLKRANAVNAELALLGYTLAPDALEALAGLGRAGIESFRKSSREFLSELSGAKSNHAALYNRFPYDTPDHEDYLFRRILGHFRTALGVKRNDHAVLSCGHVVDNAAFPDVMNFSACPICQFQVDELRSFDEVRHAYQRMTPLKVLSLAGHGFVRAKAGELLGRQSSLSADERAFLSLALERYDLQVPETVYRENLPFAYAAAKGDLGKVRPLLSGATDVLRIAVWASDRNADLSLSEPVRFKVSTSHAKAILSLLDGTDGPEEDMLRHRERWLRLGEFLHPGSERNRRRYPRAAAAFDVLRRQPGAVQTFSRKVERMVRTKQADRELVSLLSARPGEFLRRLDFMLREGRGADDVLKALPDAASAARTEMLLGLWKYIGTRTEKSQTRVFVPKGISTKLQVLEDRRPPLDVGAVEAVRDVLADEIERRLAGLPPLGRVYVDQSLKSQLVPFNRRGDSATTAPVTKGSRFSFGNTPVVRMFAHWTGHVDVDLSVACYNEDFKLLAQVSFMNTKSRSWRMVHSGDVQNAPNGASEFIDFEPDHLLAMGARYVVGHLISFRGQSFSGFPCFAGFMERDKLRSGGKYEPESVALKFDVKSKTTDHMPLIFDLETREVVFADIAGGGARRRTVVGQSERIAAAAKAVLDMPRTKPTLWDVAMFHALARGDLVDDIEQADMVFSRDTMAGIDVMDEDAMSKIAGRARAAETEISGRAP